MMIVHIHLRLYPLSRYLTWTDDNLLEQVVYEGSARGTTAGIMAIGIAEVTSTDAHPDHTPLRHALPRFGLGPFSVFATEHGGRPIADCADRKLPDRDPGSAAFRGREFSGFVHIDYRESVKRLYFRGDAAFANPEIYEFLETERTGYTIRLPANTP
jgi:hypothetical protein